MSSGKFFSTGKGFTGAAGVSRISKRLEQLSEAMKHLLPLLFGGGEIERGKLEAGFDIAFQVRAELLDHFQAVVLLADHPEAAPGLIGRAAVAGVEVDLFDRRAGVFEAEGRSRGKSASISGSTPMPAMSET